MKSSTVLLGVCIVLIILRFGRSLTNQTEKTYTRIYVQFYEEQRLVAVRGDIHQAAKSLKTVAEYEPLKVSWQSDLGRALKVVRQGAIREIIARMRTLTGEDLGDDAEPWIKKYYSTESSRSNQPAAGTAGIGRELRGLLVGTWAIEGRGETSLVADGTFSSRWTNAHASPKASWYYDGIWAVTGGVCVTTITNSRSLGTTNRVAAGKTDRFRVLHVDDRQLVWEVDNQTNSFTRRK